ncbi:PTS galactosamine transporter subunit IIC [Lactovum miscens]|uniref:PTS system galactosamine-specific IIC component n=1 Tax=Lactovum miscens TaxID=190387 RepID=A0A841CBJ8_9LACT|nr:PTS galactosamine transporter subunit IIC [Lactovum miscens]MBB5888550.1 PTS system galactosamine-specific IIC component [Lactovum miscens]
MHVTLIQGLLLSIAAIIQGVDFWLEGLYIFRPIIVAPIAGLILGDLQTGLIVGGVTELAFAGLTPAGGTQPPNPILAGVMGVVIAHTTGAKPEAAMALALPFSLLMQYVILFFYSTFAFFMRQIDAAAYAGDTKKVGRINITTTGIVAITYGIIVFLTGYLAQTPMRVFVSSLPTWLTHGFEVIGGILPAIGFAMLLNTMLKMEFMPFLLIGFILSSFLNFSNLLPVAVVGLALAIYTYTIDQKIKNNKPKLVIDPNLNPEGEDFSNGI